MRPPFPPDRLPKTRQIEAWIGDRLLRYLLSVIVVEQYPKTPFQQLESRISACLRNSALSRYANNNRFDGQFNVSPTVVEAYLHRLMLKDPAAAKQLVFDIFVTDPGRIIIDKEEGLVPLFQQRNNVLLLL